MSFDLSEFHRLKSKPINFEMLDPPEDLLNLVEDKIGLIERRRTEHLNSISSVIWIAVYSKNHQVLATWTYIPQGDSVSNVNLFPATAQTIARFKRDGHIKTELLADIRAVLRKISTFPQLGYLDWVERVTREMFPGHKRVTYYLNEDGMLTYIHTHGKLHHVSDIDLT